MFKPLRFHDVLRKVLKRHGAARDLSHASGVSKASISHYADGQYPSLASFDKLIGPLAEGAGLSVGNRRVLREEIEAHHRAEVDERWREDRRPDPEPLQPGTAVFIHTDVYDRLVAAAPRDRTQFAAVLSLVPNQIVNLKPATRADRSRTLRRFDRVPTVADILAVAEELGLADGYAFSCIAWKPKPLSLGVYTMGEVRAGGWPVGADWRERLEFGSFPCRHCGRTVITHKSRLRRYHTHKSRTGLLRHCPECRDLAEDEKRAPDPADYPTLRAYFQSEAFDSYLKGRRLTHQEVCREADGLLKAKRLSHPEARGPAGVDLSTIAHFLPTDGFPEGRALTMDRETSDAIAKVLGVNRYALWNIRETAEGRRAQGRRLVEQYSETTPDPKDMRAARGKQDAESKRQAGQYGATVRKKKTGYRELRQRHAIDYGVKGWGKIAEKAAEIRSTKDEIRKLDAEELDAKVLASELLRAKALKRIAVRRLKLATRMEELLGKIRAMTNEQPKAVILRELIENPRCNVAELSRRHGFEEGTVRTWLWQLRKAGVIPEQAMPEAWDLTSP